jgi:hypothetical protein
MPDLWTIVTSAAVATLISTGVAYITSARQRSHETTMEKLADARALRDRKIERLWRGLTVVCEVALDLLDATNRLWLHQARVIDEADRVQYEADAKLAQVGAALVLDSDSEGLVRQVVECSDDYRKYVVAMRMLIDTRERRGDTSSSEPIVKAAWLKARTDAYTVLTAARRTLAEIEKPIGAAADIRGVPTTEYITSDDAEAVEKARAGLTE